MAGTCPKKNIAFCITVLAALNLGIVLVIAQVPIPFLSFDEIAKTVNGQVKQDPLMTMYQANSTQSCIGGMVSCHANIKQAGL